MRSLVEPMHSSLAQSLWYLMFLLWLLHLVLHPRLPDVSRFGLSWPFHFWIVRLLRGR